MPLFKNESKSENDFHLHEIEPVVGTNFYMNGFVPVSCLHPF